MANKNNSFIVFPNQKANVYYKVILYQLAVRNPIKDPDYMKLIPF